MRSATISNLKAKLSEYVAWVKRGEEVLVTERGKPVARLVPVAPDTAEDERIQALVKRGVVRPGTGDMRDLLPHLPVCRVREGAVLEALEEERRDQA